MSNYDDLKREQEKTNFWLAFMAGSMISVPAWLSGAIDVAFVIMAVVGGLIMIIGLMMKYEWFNLIMWMLILGLVVTAATESKAAGAMFWDSNGNYVGQVLSAGPNAAQVFNGNGTYVGQVLKSGPNALQFYDGNGSYAGQALNSGPIQHDIGGMDLRPNSSDLSNITGNHPESSDLSNITGMHLQ